MIKPSLQTERVLLTPPPPQLLDRPGVIRWAVGSPNGPRSHTWSVVGHANTDDVYIGLRQHMGDMKLSLHPGKWRMAPTDHAARRAITWWEKPAEVMPGWRCGADIIILTDHLGPGYPEKRVKRGGVSWWPASGPGGALYFRVMLGTPDREGLTFESAIGEVGRMPLASGACVWVVAGEHSLTDEQRAWFEALRGDIARRVPAGDDLRGWAWTSSSQGGPYLIDLSSLT